MPIAHCVFKIHHLQVTIQQIQFAYCPLPIVHLQFTIHHLQLTIQHLPFTICSLPIAHLKFTIYNLPFTICPLPIAHLKFTISTSFIPEPNPILPSISSLFPSQFLLLNLFFSQGLRWSIQAHFWLYPNLLFSIHQ